MGFQRIFSDHIITDNIVYNDYDFQETVACEISPDNTVLKIYAVTDIDCTTCHV